MSEDEKEQAEEIREEIDPKDVLRERRRKLYQSLKIAHVEYLRAKKVFEHFHQIYFTLRDDWEQCDKQLAVLDGRLKHEEPSASGKAHRVSKKKEFNINDLTEEQVKELCAKLGIVLPEVES